MWIKNVSFPKLNSFMGSAMWRVRQSRVIRQLETLETRELMTCTATGVYYGAPGQGFAHTVTVTLSNESPQACTVNASQVNPAPNSGTVHANITGTNRGPANNNLAPASPAVPHGSEILIDVNGSLVATLTNFTDLGKVTGADKQSHRLISFSQSINLAAGQETSSVDILVENTLYPVNPASDPPNPATPISHWKISVDTVLPTATSLTPIPTSASPLNAVSLNLNKSIVNTLSASALTLVRNGMPILLDNSVTITPVNSQGYSITGLNPFTTQPGSYVLSVSNAAFKDSAGNIGTGATSTSFTVQPLVSVGNVSIVQNKKHQVTGIVLTYTGTLNAGEAASTATYRLATAGKKGSFTAKNAAVLKLKSAAYNESNNTVTLTPLKPFTLSKPVQLRVYGSGSSALQDSLGRFIDGQHSGQPGSDAVFLIKASGVGPG